MGIEPDAIQIVSYSRGFFADKLMKLPVRFPVITRRQAAPHNAEGLAFDCELAWRIREGDRTALSTLVERHLPRVNRYVLHRLGPGHSDLAESVVRATFEQALKKLGPYARKATATPMEFWLIRLAELRLSKQYRPPKQKDVEKIRPITVKEGEELAIVRNAMSTLPRRYSWVLSLAVLEGMSAEGIAYTLGMGQARAMRRLRAALARIGKRLIVPALEGL